LNDHYYSEKPATRHQVRIIEETLRGRAIRFKTDAGVFSKAGVDFGSKLLIETMDLPLKAKVLDIGCGYGPIGLTAAACSAERLVTMADINERAVELAKANAELNGIKNVEIVKSDLFAGLTERGYDAILTNPPIRAGKAVVHRIFEQAADYLRMGGQLWVVIQKKQGAPSAFGKLQEIYQEVKEVAKDKGYRIFCATK
jgi:16S rRNA (guanine1207-N2)-methyltransferase